MTTHTTASPDGAILAELANLRAAVVDLQRVMTSVTGARLTREQLAARLGVHRNTLASWMRDDALFPRPDRRGKWLLSEVIEWEQRR